MENMKNKLQLIFGDWSLGVKGENFHYIFSYKTGGLESFMPGEKSGFTGLPCRFSGGH